MLRYSSFGVCGGLLHLLILGFTVARIVQTVEPDWPKYWILFLALDFPVSLGVIPVNWLAPPSSAGPLHDPTNFWWPLLYHGVLGTGWWYIVGWAIERKIWRRERPGSPGEDCGGEQ